MRLSSLLVVLSMAALVSACTGFESHKALRRLDVAPNGPDAFTQTLSAEYRDFAQREQSEEFDFADAKYFADKSLAAAQGLLVAPELPQSWEIRTADADVLNKARTDLITALDQGARSLVPHHAAIAQARFDCWIEQSEENWESRDPYMCREEFYKALALIQAEIRGQNRPPLVAVYSHVPKPAQAAPSPQTAPQQPVKQQAMQPDPRGDRFVVFFDFDMAMLKKDAVRQVETAVKEIYRLNPISISVIGHADTSGKSGYNKALAQKRADAVKAALVERGIDRSLITSRSAGEEDLLVNTGDNVREGANRRAEIVLQRFIPR